MTKPQLRAWIKARDITQQDAATLLGLSRSSLMRQLADYHADMSAHPVGKQTEIICRLFDQIEQREVVDAASNTVDGRIYAALDILANVR